MKYKPCCDRRCLVHDCEEKESGGCYCVCRLMIAKNQCEMFLEGTVFKQNGACIFRPGNKTTVSEEKKAEYSKILNEIQAKLKTYEIKE
jgi:hypothetical protein